MAEKAPQKRDPKSQTWLPHEENTRKSVQDAKTGRFISPYDVLRNRVANQTPETAVKWFRRKIKELGIPDPMSYSQIVRAGQKSKDGPVGVAGAGVIGKMMFYSYDAKTKDKLKYWDLLPLVFWFNFSTGKDGTQIAEGINFHYLPYAWRMRLLGKLMEIAQQPMSPDDKLMLSWEFLGNVAKFPEVRVCVKKYLMNHIRSRLMVVAPDDWAMAIMLPFEQFQKAPMAKVHRDSTRKISNLRRGK
jgi:hypothetical protein